MQRLFIGTLVEKPGIFAEMPRNLRRFVNGNKGMGVNVPHDVFQPCHLHNVDNAEQNVSFMAAVQPRSRHHGNAPVQKIHQLVADFFAVGGNDERRPFAAQAVDDHIHHTPRHKNQNQSIKTLFQAENHGGAKNNQQVYAGGNCADRKPQLFFQSHGNQMYAAAAAAAPQNQAVTAADHDAAENCRQQRIVVVNHNALEKAQYDNLQENGAGGQQNELFMKIAPSIGRLKMRTASEKLMKGR